MVPPRVRTQTLLSGVSAARGKPIGSSPHPDRASPRSKDHRSTQVWSGVQPIRPLAVAAPRPPGSAQSDGTVVDFRFKKGIAHDPQGLAHGEGTSARAPEAAPHGRGWSPAST